MIFHNEQDDDDGEGTATPIYPRRWSWLLVGSMATETAATIVHAAAHCLTDVSIALVAHAQWHKGREEMADEAAREIETLTGATT